MHKFRFFLFFYFLSSFTPNQIMGENFFKFSSFISLLFTSSKQTIRLSLKPWKRKLTEFSFGLEKERVRRKLTYHFPLTLGLLCCFSSFSPEFQTHITPSFCAETILPFYEQLLYFFFLLKAMAHVG